MCLCPSFIISLDSVTLVHAALAGAITHFLCPCFFSSWLGLHAHVPVCTHRHAAWWTVLPSLLQTFFPVWESLHICSPSPVGAMQRKWVWRMGVRWQGMVVAWQTRVGTRVVPGRALRGRSEREPRLLAAQCRCLCSLILYEFSRFLKVCKYIKIKTKKVWMPNKQTCSALFAYSNLAKS